MFSKYDFWVLIAGKAIKGITLGILSGVVPIYVCEVFDRGYACKVLSFFQCAIPFGIFLSASVAYVGSLASFAFFPESLASTWALASAPMTVAFFLTPFIRDSPKDYFAFGNAAMALELIERHSNKGTMDDREFREYVQQRAMEMMASSNTQINEQSGGDLIKSTGTKRKFSMLKMAVECFKSTEVLTATFTQCAVQFSGINTFMYYFSEVCTLSNVKTETIPILTLCLFGSNFLANFLGSLYASKVSRVMSMFYGFLVMGLCHMLLFLALQSKKTGVSKEASSADSSGTLAIVYCFTAVVSFALAIAVPAMLYTSEIIPSNLSEIGMPIAVAFGWFLNFALSLILPILFQAMSSYVFTFFGAFCIVLYATFLNLEDTYVPSEIKIIDLDVDTLHENYGSDGATSSDVVYDKLRNITESTLYNSTLSNHQTVNKGTLLSVRGTIKGGLTRNWTRRHNDTTKGNPYVTRPNKLSVISSFRGPRLAKEVADSMKPTSLFGVNSSHLGSIHGSDAESESIPQPQVQLQPRTRSYSIIENSEPNILPGKITQHTGFYQEDATSFNMGFSPLVGGYISRPVMRKPSGGPPESGSDVRYGYQNYKSVYDTNDSNDKTTAGAVNGRLSYSTFNDSYTRRSASDSSMAGVEDMVNIKF